MNLLNVKSVNLAQIGKKCHGNLWGDLFMIEKGKKT